MKFTVFLACMIIFLKAISQPSTTYYDYDWKPCNPLVARFFSFIEKNDSGWLRQDYFMANKQLQMKALYKDSACKIRTGRSIWFHQNGNVSEINTAIHNKIEGISIDYYSNGMMKDSAEYRNGVKGYYFGWYRNGVMSDSTAPINDSMDIAISWFDNGNPAFAGFLKNGKWYGKWQFFHKNGNKAADEIYNQSTLVSRKYYDESGMLEADTTNKNKPAEFKGGMAGWLTYLERNLYFPPAYKFENGNMAVVGIELTIGEDGKVEFAEVTTPFHPEFDKIALRTIQQSPPWKPAVSHNRAVKYRFRQSVTFQQPD